MVGVEAEVAALEDAREDRFARASWADGLAHGGGLTDGVLGVVDEEGDGVWESDGVSVGGGEFY